MNKILDVIRKAKNLAEGRKKDNILDENEKVYSQAQALQCNEEEIEELIADPNWTKLQIAASTILLLEVIESKQAEQKAMEQEPTKEQVEEEEEEEEYDDSIPELAEEEVFEDEE